MAFGDYLLVSAEGIRSGSPALPGHPGNAPLDLSWSEISDARLDDDLLIIRAGEKVTVVKASSVPNFFMLLSIISQIVAVGRG